MLKESCSFQFHGFNKEEVGIQPRFLRTQKSLRKLSSSLQVFFLPLIICSLLLVNREDSIAVKNSDFSELTYANRHRCSDSTENKGKLFWFSGNFFWFRGDFYRRWVNKNTSSEESLFESNEASFSVPMLLFSGLPAIYSQTLPLGLAANLFRLVTDFFCYNGAASLSSSTATFS